MSSWNAPEIGERTVVVLGAGVLGEEVIITECEPLQALITGTGRRIACSWVAGGYNTVIRDPSAEQRTAAVHFIENNLEGFAKILHTNAVKPGTYAAVKDLDSAVANAWFVIEAVPEKLELKISIFKDLALKTPRDCILGSNSSSYKSSMMVDQVDDESKKRVLNVHYTMPAATRTVELMTSTYTHEQIFPFLVEHHKKIGLLPAVARKESTGYETHLIPLNLVLKSGENSFVG
jgi:3-hydroxyacyl-CoA dehydrogenase